MSSNEVVLSVRGLAKSYQVGRALKHTALAEALVHRLRSPFRRTKPPETFWALKDVSFDLRRGEVLGVIGRNGAGKSTLLKIISRITEPTDGEVHLYGRTGSLLEVGTGFHPELTGRENIYLNGAFLGMKRAEIARKFDEIVAFADVEKFLDTPVKRYSSGMYMRLAFAVAAHLEPEILVVDEVLAVGDTAFQEKCLAKMDAVAKRGQTVLFVSHQLSAVASLCKKAMLLHAGRLEAIGPVQAIIERYITTLAAPPRGDSHTIPRAGTGEVRYRQVTSDKETYLSGEEISLNCTFSVIKPSGKIAMSFLVLNDQHQIILHIDTRLVGHWLDGNRANTRVTIRGPWLKPGRYRIDAYLSTNVIIDQYEAATFFAVLPILPYPVATNDQAAMYGLVLPDFTVREE
jgi:lipopolysaccharide transport system ATP-binding protein